MGCDIEATIINLLFFSFCFAAYIFFFKAFFLSSIFEVSFVAFSRERDQSVSGADCRVGDLSWDDWVLRQ
jgi:hypothetical protein